MDREDSSDSGAFERVGSSIGWGPGLWQRMVGAREVESGIEKRNKRI